ncbi:MAG TPA: hypothetical protein VGE29_13975 [Prosthecobacter sp.]
MKSAARILLVAALMISVGLHWAVMQSVAWVGMAVTYSVKQGSVIQGLSDTFDGQHGCALCHAVEEGTKKPSPKKESTPAKDLKDLKLHLAVCVMPHIIFQTPSSPHWITTSETGARRTWAPEPPPPRLA